MRRAVSMAALCLHELGRYVLLGDAELPEYCVLVQKVRKSMQHMEVPAQCAI